MNVLYLVNAADGSQDIRRDAPEVAAGTGKTPAAGVGGAALRTPLPEPADIPDLQPQLDDVQVL